jgi:hypothetical protein
MSFEIVELTLLNRARAQLTKKRASLHIVSGFEINSSNAHRQESSNAHIV